MTKNEKFNLILLTEKFDNFCASTEKELNLMKGTQTMMRKEIRAIRDNHLSHIADRLTAVESNQKWVMKILWALVTGVISNLIGIIYLVINKFI